MKTQSTQSANRHDSHAPTIGRAGWLAMWLGIAASAGVTGLPVLAQTIDLNRDGLVDFEVVTTVYELWPPLQGTNTHINLVPRGTNAIHTNTTFVVGQTVDPADAGAWRPTDSLLLYERGEGIVVWGGRGGPQPYLRLGGLLFERTNVFLGLRFAAADGLHYGWAHFAGWGNTALEETGFQPEPDLPILVGQNPRPIIAQQPQNLSLTEGQTAAFAVRATGRGLSYQWVKEGVPLSDSAIIHGATSNQVAILDVEPVDAGEYWVEVTAAQGQTVSSAPASLTVVGQVSWWALFKLQAFEQTCVCGVQPLASNAWQAMAVLEPAAGQPTNIQSVRLAVGTNVLDLAVGGPRFTVVSEYNSQAALDADVPNGAACTLTWNSFNRSQRSSTLSFPAADDYPAVAPTIQDVFLLEALPPGEATTIRWQPFTGGTTADFIRVEVWPETGSKLVMSSPGLGMAGALDGTATSFSIPGLSGNAAYDLVVHFVKLTRKDTASPAGATGGIGYGKLTRTRIRTTKAAEPGRLDLNQDGAQDFWIEAGSEYIDLADRLSWWNLVALATNAIHTNTSLAFGDMVGAEPPSSWGRSGSIQLYKTGYLRSVIGPIREGLLSWRTDVYLGLRFAAADGAHYGWAQFSRPGDYESAPYFVDAASQPLPGMPIQVGDKPAPHITQQPTDQTVTVGQTAVLAVQAPGAWLSYQWMKAGVPLTNSARICGATSAQLAIPNAQAADAGDYWVVVRYTDTQKTTSAVVGLKVGVGIFLHVRRSGDQLVLSWDSSLTGCKLQTSPTLEPASWVDVPGVSGNSCALPLNGAKGFYRLHRDL